jgi:D-alanine transaminase
MAQPDSSSSSAEAVVYLNGVYVQESCALIKVSDRGFLFADGVYEVTRAEPGSHLFLEAAHLRRLARGLRELRIDAPGLLSSLPGIARELLRANGLCDATATVYVQVTRGAHSPRAHVFPPAGTPATVYVAARPLAVPAAAAGASAVCVPDERWARCDLKTVSLLPNVLAKQRAAEAGAYEALLVRGGAVVEASHSNAFAVLDGELWTAPLDNILPGVSRAVIVERAHELGLTVVERAIPLERLASASEVFVSSTGPDVQAITSVDGKPVADGAVGPVVLALR